MPQRLSFQLYSARNAQPWEAVLKHLAACGYIEVEGFGGAAGTPGAFYDEPQRFRALLDQHGLNMPTGHFFPLDLFETDRKRVIAIARALGMTHVYCPYVPPEERKDTAAFWKSFGKRLAETGKQMNDAGLGFGWHSHDFEFKKLKDGSFPIDRIFEGGPLLDWECDIGWLIRAKQSPSRWLKTYGERITAVHVKDNAPADQNLDQHGQTDVGAGTGDWPAIFKAIRNTTRCLHYVVEHDDPKDFTSFARNSFRYLSRI